MNRINHHVRAAMVAEMGGRFEVRNLALDEPGAGEVLIKIDAVGVCHTTWWPVKSYGMAEIDQAARDMRAGRTIEPAVDFGGESAPPSL